MVALGAKPVTAQPLSKLETIDASSIRYSMPTFAADELRFVMPTAESFEGARRFTRTNHGLAGQTSVNVLATILDHGADDAALTMVC